MKPSKVEIEEVTMIVKHLDAAGVHVRVAGGQLVVRGAGALDRFPEALATLAGREKACVAALELERRATLPQDGRSRSGRTRGARARTARPGA